MSPRGAGAGPEAAGRPAAAAADTAAEILASSSPGEVRAAVVRDGQLLDYEIWRPGTPDGVGDVHRGRVLARLPALAGSFVALEGAEGFLPDSEGDPTATEGSILGVRITRAAQGGKGPRLTARLAVEERAALHQAGLAGPPSLVRRGPDAVTRLAAEHPGAPVLADDRALLAALRPVLGQRIAYRPEVFDEALAAEIEALGEPVASLPGGMRAHFHPTPALVAVDIDGGAESAARREKRGAQLDANRAALPELARQIRLRNLAGAILVDFAGMPARARAALGPELAAVLAGDPLRPRLLGFTALGLAEILRPRVRAPLHELLAGPLAAGLAALRRVALEVAARPGWVPALRAGPAVAAALRADPVALPDLERRAGRSLILRSDPALSLLGWHVEESAGAD